MKKRNLDLRQMVAASRLEIGAAIGLALAAALLLFRLGAAPKAASAGETQTYFDNSQLHQILHNPLNAPYKLLDFGLTHLHQHNLFFARLASVIFALLAVVLFFLIVQRWHGKRNAWLAAILFASSGWLLHVGRLGTENIVWITVPLALIWLGSWIGPTEKSEFAILLSAFIIGFSLLVPGGIWFVIAFLILQHKALAEHFAEAERGSIAGAAVIIIAIIGIVAFSIVRSPELLRHWAGLATGFPGITLALKQWADSIVYLFARGPGTPELWLAHTPILNVFETALVILGGFFYIRHFRNMRAQSLLVYFLIGSVLVAVNGAVAMSFVVPIAYLTAATGIAYLLHKWLGVFPRNPLARNFGLGLLCVAILASVFYHLMAYYIAWQHSPDTIATFSQNLLK